MASYFDFESEMTPESCYDHSVLADAAAGRLPTPQAELILQHAETCARCEQILIDQETKPEQCDPLLEVVRESSPTDSADLPGQIGDYIVERRLGEGGLGVVFLARHRLLSNPCVIKVVQTRFVHRTDIQQRFLREMKVLSGLQHENIVQVFSAGMWQDQPYLVMEYLQGEDLEQRVRRDGPLSVDEACQVIADAAEALDYAHGQQVTHRDIKPSNLFANHSGETKVIDFGLARMVSKAEADLPNMSTREGTIPGTPEYMSPEQFRSSKVGSESDVYSLGGTFVFLLTGKPPVTGSVMDLMRHHSDPEPSDSAPAMKRFPSRISSLVRQMLSRDPARRPSSMNEVAVALRAFLDQTHSDSTSAPALSTPAVGPKRWRILMFSLLALIAPVALVAAFGWPLQLPLNDTGRNTNAKTNIAEHPTVDTAINAVAKFEIADELRQAVSGSIRRRNDATELVDDKAGILYSLRVTSLPNGPNGKRLWPAIFSREQTNATARLLKVESIRKRAQRDGLTDTSGLDEAINTAAADPQFVGTVKELSSHQLTIDGSSVVLVHAPQQQIDATLQSEIAMGRLREAYRNAVHGQSEQLMQQERWAESLELWRHLHKLELTSPRLGKRKGTQLIN